MADRTDDRTKPTSVEQEASDLKAHTMPPDKPLDPKKREIGGPKGPEPTRYGDWEKGGRCIDF